MSDQEFSRLCVLYDCFSDCPDCNCISQKYGNLASRKIPEKLQHESVTNYGNYCSIGDKQFTRLCLLYDCFIICTHGVRGLRLNFVKIWDLASRNYTEMNTSTVRRAIKNPAAYVSCERERASVSSFVPPCRQPITSRLASAAPTRALLRRAI